MPSGDSYAALFDSLCDEYAGMSGVTVPEGGSGFGSNAIKINKSIFAMLVNDRLVVKLPGARVTELISSGYGVPFDAGKGRPMKEWVGLTVDEDACRKLVAEAMAFVGKR
jgi:TfoX/Sxy family transcriptional regulator of competence genes